MTTRQKLMAFAAPIALLAAPADAAIFAFDLTGSYTAAFRIDSALLSPPATFDADTFIVDGIAGTFDGVATRAESITFNVKSFDGGLTIQVGTAFFNFFGDALFTGTTARPTFLPGNFALLQDGDAALPARLTIAEVAAPVPEPASWVMMIAGFGAMGYAMRRRRAQVRLQPA